MQQGESIHACSWMSAESGISGVGSTLIQIAKKVIGVKRVIGIAGGAKKCEWCVELDSVRVGWADPS